MMLVALHINSNILYKQPHHRILTLFIITYFLHNSLLIPILIISPDKLLYIDLAVPFGLMYGPLMFFYYKSFRNYSISNMTILFNLIPIVISWVAYFLFILNENIRFQTDIFYYPILYGCIGISLISYSLYIIINESRNRDNQILFLSFFLIITGIFMSYLSFEVYIKKPQIVISQDIGSSLTMSLFMSIGGLILLDLVNQLFKSQYKHSSSRNKLLLSNMNYEDVMKYDDNNTNSQQIKNVAESNKTTQTKKEKELIESFFIPEYLVDKTMDLSKAANILGMSRNKLQNMIYENYETTFTKLLTTKRIDYACKIIPEFESSELPNNLYELSGFKSMSTFYRNFKMLTGCTPSQYKA